MKCRTRENIWIVGDSPPRNVPITYSTAMILIATDYLFVLGIPLPTPRFKIILDFGRSNPNEFGFGDLNPKYFGFVGITEHWSRNRRPSLIKSFLSRILHAHGTYDHGLGPLAANF